MEVGNLKVTVDYSDVDRAERKVVQLGDSSVKVSTKAKTLTSAFKEFSNVGGPLADVAGKIEDIGSKAASAATGVRTLATGLGLAAGVTATLATAFIAAQIGIEFVAFKMNAAADAADEMAQKLGMTMESLETFKIIASENGTTVEALVRTYDKVSKSLNKMDEDNAKTTQSFKVLGLSQSDLAGKTEAEVAGIIIKRWEELGRTTKATAAVMQTVGPAFREQIPAIKAAADGIDDARERVRRFGAEATPALVKAGGLQEKALTDLKIGWQGLANEIATLSSGMTTSIIKWAANAINSIRSVMKEWREAQGVSAASQGSISNERRTALTKQARDEVYDGSNPNATEGDVNRRLKELMQLEQRANFRRLEAGQTGEANASAAENARLAKLQRDSAAVPVGTPGKVDDTAAKAAQAEKDRMSAAGLAALRRQDEADTAAEVSANKFLTNQARMAEAEKERLARILERMDVESQAAAAEQLRHEKQMAYQADWTNGYKSATDEYVALSQNAAQQSHDAMTSATKGMEDAIVEFAMTGKASFGDLVKSIIAGIIRTQAQAAISKIFGLILAGGASYSYNGGVGTTNAAGISGGRAAGGPVGAGKTYLVGEKGPELLRMGSQGGNVIPNHAISAGGGSSQISVSYGDIIVQGGKTNEDTGAAVQKALQESTKQLVRSVLMTEKRPGGILAASQG